MNDKFKAHLVHLGLFFLVEVILNDIYSPDVTEQPHDASMKSTTNIIFT